MNDNNDNRTKFLQVRLTEKEYKLVTEKFSQSVYRKWSEFLRKKLLDKPVAVYTRNQSLDEFMREMIVLRKELNAIGNNYNQVVKRLHTLSEIKEIFYWLNEHEAAFQLLIKKTNEINSKIAQISDQWLQ
ncbi:plasmid mobilization protein [Pinibacter aurantiacus]|jgi:hypothetical protein|uniref:Plasmid mobilization relaxosome protein MobC n=1 Tax=Pinibacter aurantiacus TaxID=2851599 RepID=A0A9E2SCV0_9BACT|nr:plasmid mobilization relaxosome protein MobC [Pinibacter aurantiacus]MBV4358769.1 plasmid mobilization relaxosome protein MobC [Pinibacter aurantiacus]